MFQDKKVEKGSINVSKRGFSALIATMSQFSSVIKFPFSRIYLSLEFFDENKSELIKHMKKRNDVEFYLALPYVLRQNKLLQVKKWNELLNYAEISGVLVRNLEEVGLMEDIKYKKSIQLDYFIYCMNTSACKFWSDLGYQWTAPLELNRKELKHIYDANEMLVYGRIPVMLSANCINKTLYVCKKESNYRMLTDRMNKNFPIKSNCTYCYNVMYNSIPLSLHNYIGDMIYNENLRLEFTIEN